MSQHTVKRDGEHQWREKSAQQYETTTNTSKCAQVCCYVPQATLDCGSSRKQASSTASDT